MGATYFVSVAYRVQSETHSRKQIESWVRKVGQDIPGAVLGTVLKW